MLDELSVHCIPYSPVCQKGAEKQIRLTTMEQCKLQWLLLLIQL